jgi:NAD(P)-dependent dehydrogenase (short-subunit alcohol dehydrogenase family)
MRIQGCVALVTGANRGIGKAITDELLSRGAARVYAAVRTRDAADAMAKGADDRRKVIELDVTQPDAIAAAAKLATDVNLLVNNAGVLTATSLAHPKAADNLAWEFDVNVYGVLRMTQAFAPILKANGGGTIANINSVASIRNRDELGTYAVSKAASFSMTEAMRIAYAGQGIHVVSVHPGPIDTDMTRPFDWNKTSPQDTAKAIIDDIAADRPCSFPDPFSQDLWARFKAEPDSMWFTTGAAAI